MFAVSGWSLGPLKAEDPQNTGSHESRSSKKRKRKRGRDDGEGTKANSDGRIGSTAVTYDNVADLWNQHVHKLDEGKPANKVQGRSVGKGHKLSSAKGLATRSDHTELTSQAESNSTTADSARRKNKKKINKRKDAGETTGSLPQQQQQQQQPGEFKATKPVVAPSKPAQSSEPKLTPLQAAMRQKLTSARFRHLNQTLYTVPSSEALELFKSNPAFFEEYHAGFRQQVSSWPENPVDSFAQELKDRGRIRSHLNKGRHGQSNNQSNAQKPPLPRTSGVCTVADLGCGDARLAAEMQEHGDKLRVKITSFDLHSENPLVTKADISNLPLENSSVNVAIFCLALMGTNWVDFVDEAWRILSWKGELWVAEIKSRFARNGVNGPVNHSVGKRRKIQQPSVRNRERLAEDEEQQLRVEVDGSETYKGQTDVSAFVTVLEGRGFALSPLDSIDLSNKMFVRMHFTKSKTPTKGKHAGSGNSGRWQEEQSDTSDEAAALKPCLYKTR